MMKKQLRRKIVLLLVILGIGYLVYDGKINPSAWFNTIEQKLSEGTSTGPFSTELNEAVNRRYGQEQKADVKP